MSVIGVFVIGAIITVVETPEVADVPQLAGLPIGIMTGVAFFVGALCSMASGIIGMFVGATLLALAWQVVTGWVDESPDAIGR